MWLNMNCLCAIYVDQNQHDIIYHSFPINSQYLIMGGGELTALHLLGRVFCNAVY